ncbi:hypothetical protein [Azospirillum sp. SYSU D00513]|uniref:phage tail terminator protein n=1 Tax=Azospirillum sp. SYSU D00513 TaxID=2812561 RepID=UPI001A95F087|nr:hypothetical protein [Azospirillum sp. SYSU D00513]
MNLSLIITRLRERCPVFGPRVAGAAEFKALPETANLPVPAAYVLPLDDKAEPVKELNEFRQDIRDSFAVVVVVSNKGDERGQAAAADLHAIRAELWRALLGWEPDTDYGWIEYEGGEVVHMDRARLYYQFEFGADYTIGPEETGQGADLDALPEFHGAGIRIDAIDPADPNLSRPGPDGRIEAEADFTIPTT